MPISCHYAPASCPSFKPFHSFLIPIYLDGYFLHFRLSFTRMPPFNASMPLKLYVWLSLLFFSMPLSAFIPLMPSCSSLLSYAPSMPSLSHAPMPFKPYPSPSLLLCHFIPVSHLCLHYVRPFCLMPYLCSPFPMPQCPFRPWPAPSPFMVLIYHVYTLICPPLHSYAPSMPLKSCPINIHSLLYTLITF